jgi:protein TonB
MKARNKYSKGSAKDGKSSIPSRIKQASGITKSIEDLIKLKRVKSKSENNYSRLFFSIGLCFSLLVVITAFEWKFYDSGRVIDLGTLDSEFENVMDIPPTEQPPPPPRKLEQPKIIEVPDEEEIMEEIEIDLDIEVTEEQVIEQRIFEDLEMEKEEEEVADEIFTIVEQQPQPAGGLTAFYDYVAKNLKYPMLARRNNIEGRVYIGFVVEKDGSLTDINILKGIGGGCDEEAMRIIKNAPKWNPGKQRGRPVRVKMVLPILFQLEDY